MPVKLTVAGRNLTKGMAPVVRAGDPYTILSTVGPWSFGWCAVTAQNTRTGTIVNLGLHADREYVIA